MRDHELVKAVAVTAELTGTNLSEGAAEVLVTELAGYDRGQVLKALSLCRRQLKGRLTMASILERIDDGRPGGDEAWANAIQAHDEQNTVCWTSETASAYWAARALLDEGDRVGARMAFKAAYDREVLESRNEGRPIKWEVSLGHRVSGREPVLREAVERNRISGDFARTLIPFTDTPEILPQIEDLAKSKLIKGS